MSVVPAQTTATTPCGSRAGPGARARNVLEIGPDRPSGAAAPAPSPASRPHPVLPQLRQARTRLPDRVRGLALSEDALGGALAPRPISIELGEVRDPPPRQLSQRARRLRHGYPPPPHLLQQLPQPLQVHHPD